MSSTVSDDQIRQAVLGSVELGSYPESQDVAAAEVPSHLLPVLQSELNNARDNVEGQVRLLSKSSAGDIDQWIAQAKRVQADIERSKITAREIIQQAEGVQALKEKALDAANKVNLLEKEVAFNESLACILEEIRTASDVTDDAKKDVVQGQLQSALEKIKAARSAATKLRRIEGTRAHGLLRSRIENVQAALVERTTGFAKELLRFDIQEQRLKTSKTLQDSNDISLEGLADILSDTGELKSWTERLRRDIDRTLVTPLLAAAPNRDRNRIVKDHDQILIQKSASSPRIIDLLQDVGLLFEFLGNCLPPAMQSSLSPLLVPAVLERLENEWLNPCVPTNTDDMHDFEQLLSQVSRLAEQLASMGWTETNALVSWVEGAPRIWLARRRETALRTVRNMLFSGLKDRRTVERVETQTISGNDLMMGADQEDEAWGDEWAEENDETGQEPPATASQISAEDDDASAWDVDDGSEQVTASGEDVRLPEVDGGEEEAWGWGDDEQTQSPEKPTKATKSLPPSTNGNKVPREAGPRELTLKENYTVTAVPDGVLQVIQQIVSDAQTLADPSFAQTPVAAASSALYTLPTLILAMYRATASTSYAKLDTGNMLIYNDSLRLAEELGAFLADAAKQDATSSLPRSSRPSSRLRLENDIKALETFAKRAYSAEMESQRTVLRDLLDGAQGFSNCTVPPYAGECDSAVAQTVDRLREVYRQWQPILSHSALLQSIGSLLGTATSKMLLDIEDLSDIGEEESKSLKSYCDSVSSLRDLFVQEHPSGEGKGDMTGIYCPNWFKFQYLGEILDSSLADIKYLWTEGELSLEYGADEITDLVEALFADSDYRRRAIADIRRSGRR